MDEFTLRQIVGIIRRGVNLDPLLHDTYNLGRKTRAFKNLYLEGTLYADTIAEITSANGVNLGDLIKMGTDMALRDKGVENAIAITDWANSGYRDLWAKDFMTTDGGSFRGYPQNNRYFTFQTMDTDATNVEVGRCQGAADPYFSLGGSQEFKFYYSGTNDFAYNVMFSVSVDSVAVTDQVSVGGFDISAGHRALAISSEEVVVTEAIGASDRTLPIRINGATYKMMLVAV